jgi:hypothetical protein
MKRVYPSIQTFAIKGFSLDIAMRATRTNFDSYSRSGAQDASDSLLAFPSFGALLTRFKTTFSNWAQAAVQADAESRLWDTAQADRRIMAELVQARVRPEAAMAAPVFTTAGLAATSDKKPLNAGWGSLIEHAYQTRFHRNGAQRA